MTDKEHVNANIHEDIEFVGETGVDGILNGILPNGEPYEWSKQHRSHKRRIRP